MTIIFYYNTIFQFTNSTNHWLNDISWRIVNQTKCRKLRYFQILIFRWCCFFLFAYLCHVAFWYCSCCDPLSAFLLLRAPSYSCFAKIKSISSDPACSRCFSCLSNAVFSVLRTMGITSLSPDLYCVSYPPPTLATFRYFHLFSIFFIYIVTRVHTRDVL